MTPGCELDLADPGFVADPYPALAGLRAQGPLLWHEPSQRWLATTHAAVGQTLRGRGLGRIWADWEPAGPMQPFNALHSQQMMENEPPAHTRLRRLVAGAFARGHVERMRPRVESLAAQLLDQLDGPGLPSPGSADILARYAEPLPVLVIADLLGVPGEDHEQLRAWSQAIVHMYEPDPADGVKAAAVQASADFSAYVRDVVAERKAAVQDGDGGEDLITDLIAARDDQAPGDQAAGGSAARLSEDELVASIVLLLNAGHEASVNAFGNGIHALLTHRDQLARITSGEVPVATALEELIRFDSPLQLFERTATRDVEIVGQKVAAGEKVACLMGSANRDAATFDRADEFDVAREPNPHVGFGMGVHFCLGAPLARMELEISLRRLLERYPQLRLGDTAPRRPTWVLRGFERIDTVLN